MIEKAKLKALIDQGMTATAIAKELGCSVSTVCFWAKQHGIAPNWRAGSRHWAAKATEEDARLAIALSDEGLGIKEISDKLELPYSIINQIVGGRNWLHV